MPKRTLPTKKEGLEMRLNLKQRAFLAAFSLFGNIRVAAIVAKVARRSHYYWLTQHQYAAAFREARQEALDNLMAEAWRRGVEGVEVPVFYQGKMCFERVFDPQIGQMRTTNKPLTIRKYSDTLLTFLAKVMMPEKYGDIWTGGFPRRGRPAKSWPGCWRCRDTE